MRHLRITGLRSLERVVSKLKAVKKVIERDGKICWRYVESNREVQIRRRRAPTFINRFGIAFFHQRPASEPWGLRPMYNRPGVAFFSSDVVESWDEDES
jgi:hypothetical protein